MNQSVSKFVRLRLIVDNERIALVAKLHKQTMSNIDQVRISLLYYNYWTNVQTLQCNDGITVLTGIPPESIHPTNSVDKNITIAALPEKNAPIKNLVLHPVYMEPTQNDTVTSITSSEQVLQHNTPYDNNDEDVVIQETSLANVPTTVTTSTANETIIEYGPKVEFVYPIRIHEKVTMQFISKIFENIEEQISVRPKRVILGILGDDGTIVYYFVHDGIVKPKKN